MKYRLQNTGIESAGAAVLALKFNEFCYDFGWRA